MLTIAAAVFVSMLVATPAPPQASRPAQDLARDLQRKYDQVRDFSADFLHTYEGGVLRKKVTERGTVLIKKPGKMHWTYTSPEKKEFVSDGVKIYSYVPEDRQVVVTTVAPADEASSPALFLAGKGNVSRDFKPSLADFPGIGPGEVALKLVPSAQQREYDWLVLVLDVSSLQIRRLVTTDAQGGTSMFVFTNLKENVGLPDKAFTFVIPRGVELITDATRSR
ncbi:MAG TPA: outer membrane lipoprotein carrier protein LolA [Vicinamibacterales bacterium]|jgi:outer membrane lipoprotein carrier protein